MIGIVAVHTYTCFNLCHQTSRYMCRLGVENYIVQTAKKEGKETY